MVRLFLDIHTWKAGISGVRAKYLGMLRDTLEICRVHIYPQRRGKKAATLHPLQQAECQEQMSLKQCYQCPHCDIWSVFSHVRYCVCIGDLIFICFIFAADNKSYSKSKEIIIIYISRKKMLTRWRGACRMRISSFSFSLPSLGAARWQSSSSAVLFIHSSYLMGILLLPSFKEAACLPNDTRDKRKLLFSKLVLGWGARGQQRTRMCVCVCVRECRPCSVCRCVLFLSHCWITFCLFCFSLSLYYVTFYYHFCALNHSNTERFAFTS